MILIECSDNGYELIAESPSRSYLENLRRFEEGYGQGDPMYNIPTCAENSERFYMPSQSAFVPEPTGFRSSLDLLIVPRSIIGRKGDMSLMEALQEKFPLPSMLKERLSQLNQL